MRRLQLRGSGGFSPRFPNIAPADFYGLIDGLDYDLPFVPRCRDRDGFI